MYLADAYVVLVLMLYVHMCNWMCKEVGFH